MAKYTTQLRSIVESGTPVFDFDYPIFDESYRKVLEQKIIDTYYFREIGLETVGQFKHFLKSKLNNIMPYYNEQYLALEVFKTYDPYVNKDITVSQKRTNSQESTGKANSTSKSDSTNTSESTSNGREIYSDTPQGKLSNLDYATNLTDSDATGTTNDNGSVESIGSTTSEGVITSTDDYIETIKGFDGMKYASEVYLGVKETIINLDQEILDELNDLFMNIY